jgi:hypothetical protein
MLSAKRQQFIVAKKGKRRAVILPFAQYERLLEDLHDLARVAERRQEEPLGMSEMKKRLKSHGLL